MNLLKTISLVVTLSFLITDAKGQISVSKKSQIQKELQSKFGREFGIEIVEFDKLKSSKYKDPYNTLEGCFIIMARSYGGDLVAIYKNGTLLWNSDPILDNGSITNFVTSRDVNNDGEVELFFGWWFGMNPRGAFIWIFSWDGEEGTMVNSYDEDRKGGSNIYAGGEVLFFPDKEADGIFEIMTYGLPDNDEDYDEDPITTFKWNGSEYILSESVPENELKLESFVKDQLSLDVSAKVEREENKFRYKYAIKNEPESWQALNEFYLDTNYKELSRKKSRVGWKLLATRYGLINWHSTNYDFSIKPGHVDSSFGFDAQGIPTLIKYHGQGYNEHPPIASLNVSDEEYITDIRKNSISGQTLGPKYPPSPFDQQSFFDSLRSYLDYSCTNEWVTNQGICRSLQAKLDNVERQLGRGNTKPAVGSLRAFLNEVEAQNGKHITSEGYALLYYNGQYLLERLEEQSGGNKGGRGPKKN